MNLKIILIGVFVLILLITIVYIFLKKTQEGYTNYNSVPKILHRTLLWDDDVPKDVKPMYDKFNNENSDWEVKLWRKKDVDDLFDKYKLTDMLNSCKVKIQKADLARYLIIYDQGGCYCDFDIKSDYTLNDILKQRTNNEELILITELCYNEMKGKEQYCSSNKIFNGKIFVEQTMQIRNRDPNNNSINEEPHRIGNFFLMAQPKSQNLWNLIKLAKQRLKLKTTNQYDVLYTTGPALVSSFYEQNKNNNIKILHSKFLDHVETGTWRNQIKKV